ncbi:MAG: DNA polymerase III subunit delta, partial [Duodenibacillus sp.]|nr:DNA polymerase III subunit delta [Duodenibacillus sp.]
MQTLLAMRGRLPNGILIYGARGIGTFQAACAFGASLMCTSPNPDGSRCGHCKGCRMVDSNTHPDLRFVVSEFECVANGVQFLLPEDVSEKKTLSREILIGQTRELGDFFGLKSHEGGNRVVIV